MAVPKAVPKRPACSSMVVASSAITGKSSRPPTFSSSSTMLLTSNLSTVSSSFVSQVSSFSSFSFLSIFLQVSFNSLLRRVASTVTSSITSTVTFISLILSAATTASALFFSSCIRLAAARFSSAISLSSILFTCSKATSNAAMNLFNVPKKSVVDKDGFSPKYVKTALKFSWTASIREKASFVRFSAYLANFSIAIWVYDSALLYMLTSSTTLIFDFC